MPTPSETDAATVRARLVAANDATYAAWKAHDADAVAAVFAETAVVTWATRTSHVAATRCAGALVRSWPPSRTSRWNASNGSSTRPGTRTPTAGSRAGRTAASSSASPPPWGVGALLAQLGAG